MDKKNGKNIIQNKKKINTFEYIFNEIDNDKNNKSNNIYLELYNSQIKKQNLERQQNWDKQKVFFEKNKELLKKKEELNQKKKQEEEKKRKREQYEQTKEFRQKQMEDLYLKFIKDNKQTNKYSKVKSKYKENKNSQKIENNKIIEHNKNIGKVPEYINIYKKKEKEERELENLKNNIDKLPQETIIMTENEYNLKLNLLEEEKKHLIIELNKIIISNKSNNKILERESEINNKLNDIDNEIGKMKNKFLIYIIEK